jgi:hypothetical protein
MDTSDTLFRHLCEYLREMDRDYIEETVPPEEREEDVKLRKHFKELTVSLRQACVTSCEAS